MDFNSYIFILVFLPLVLITYYSVSIFKNQTIQLLCLIFSSMLFYLYSQQSFVIFLLVSYLFNYVIYLSIYKSTLKSFSNFLLIFGIVCNVVSLGYFKYTNFTIDISNMLFHTNLKSVNLIIPLGISFITFQQIAFLIDSYREPHKKINPIEYGVFVSFFPHVSSGPIIFRDSFISELRNNTYKIDYENLSKGLLIFSMGFAKKILLADTLGNAVNNGYSNIPSLNTFSSLFIVLAFSLQLYFDFSGYCDMAIGVSKMFNIELPINFNSPYKATTIADFWDRWHITLTKFFTKYVYIPLGGSRKGSLRTYLNIFIIFLISGLWHGASYTFVVWGLLHGIAMITNRIFNEQIKKIPYVLTQLLTFIFVNIAWIVFKATSIHEAINIIKAITNPNGHLLEGIQTCFTNIGFLDLSFLRVSNELKAWLFLLIATGIVLFAPNSNEIINKCKFKLPSMLITIFLLVVCILSITGTTTYLYTMF